jgi:hypothetical protein
LRVELDEEIEISSLLQLFIQASNLRRRPGYERYKREEGKGGEGREVSKTAWVIEDAYDS